MSSIFLLTSLSYNTTSAFFISSTALSVISFGSPGPAPTRNTLPFIVCSIHLLFFASLLQAQKSLCFLTCQLPLFPILLVHLCSHSFVQLETVFHQLNKPLP